MQLIWAHHGAYYYMDLYGTNQGKPSQQSVKASRGSGRLNAKVNSMSNAIPEVIHFVVYKKSTKVHDPTSLCQMLTVKVSIGFTISWGCQCGLSSRNAQSWYFRISMFPSLTPSFAVFFNHMLPVSQANPTVKAPTPCRLLFPERIFVEQFDHAGKCPNSES